MSLQRCRPNWILEAPSDAGIEAAGGSATTVRDAELYVELAGDGIMSLTIAKIRAAFAGAVNRLLSAVIADYPITPQGFGCVGDGVTDDTAAWLAWSTAVQNGPKAGVMPNGTYLIDSWTVATPGASFSGLGCSVIIKARSVVTNFVDFSGAYGSRLDNVEIDGNNKATKCFVMTSQTFAFTSSKVRVGGVVDGGINVDLSGTTTNTQVAEMTFIDWNFGGKGNRASGSNITNLKINSNQTLVMTFIRPMFGGFAGVGDVGTHFVFPLGTVSMYTPFFTSTSTLDVRLGDGGVGGGSLTMVDGRSESSTSDSLYLDGGGADVTLVNFVHATTTNTSLAVTNNFTGRVTAVGGQYNIITNGSSSANIGLLNINMYGTGSYTGAHADRIVKLQDSLLTSARFSTKRTDAAYGASIAVAASLYDSHLVTVTNGTAFTMAAPTGPAQFQTITIEFLNSSGGAMGAVTWNAVFLLAGALTNPANGKRRKISFTYDGTNWVENWRSLADI